MFTKTYLSQVHPNTFNHEQDADHLAASALKIEKITIVRDSATALECEFCYKIFSTPRTLDEHRQKHALKTYGNRVPYIPAAVSVIEGEKKRISGILGISSKKRTR